MKILVLGKGRSGQAVKVHAERLGHTVIIWAPDEPYPDLTGLDLVITSPGIPLTEPVFNILSLLPVISELQWFIDHCPGKCIAITGTNGKSTVTSLLAHCLKKAGHRAVACGNIGHAATLTLMEPAYDYYVVEVSSYQMETTPRLCVDLACLLNITEDHLDRHGDMERYATLKWACFAHANIRVAWQPLASVAPDGIGQITCFGLDMPNPAQPYGTAPSHGRSCLATPDGLHFDLAHARLRGEHNTLNILAVFAMLDQLSVDLFAALKGLEDFEGLPHRCDIIPSDDDVLWIDDSKATNLGASLACIHGISAQYPGRDIILLAGGDAKGQNFGMLRNALPPEVKHILTFGQDGPAIYNAAPDISTATHNLEHAVSAAKAFAKPQDIILLAPACASWDSYRDFEARGQHFASLVK